MQGAKKPWRSDHQRTATCCSPSETFDGGLAGTSRVQHLLQGFVQFELVEAQQRAGVWETCGPGAAAVRHPTTQG